MSGRITNAAVGVFFGSVFSLAALAQTTYETGGTVDFKGTYCEARREFLDLVASNGRLVLDRETSAVVVPDPDALQREKSLGLIPSCGDTPIRKGEDLSMDVAYYGHPLDGDRALPRNLLVLVSGIHGVEGPAGSAVQRMFIRNYIAENKIDRDRLSVLLIHAVNPFGFKYMRRFNSENIDLNRAFFTPEELREFVGTQSYADANENYSKMSPLINAREPVAASSPVRARVEWASLLVQVLRTVDLTTAIRVFASGQYSVPQGVYYGGDLERIAAERGRDLRPQEVRAVEKVLKKYLPKFQKTLIVDLHSGVGPGDMLNLMPSVEGADRKSEQHRLLSEVFLESPAVCGGDKPYLFDAKIVFETKGDLNGYVDRLKRENVFPGVASVVTAEWGTHEPTRGEEQEDSDQEDGDAGHGAVVNAIVKAAGSVKTGRGYIAQTTSGYYLMKENQGHFHGYVQGQNSGIQSRLRSQGKYNPARFIKAQLADRFIPGASSKAKWKRKSWQKIVLEQAKCTFDRAILRNLGHD